jgi:hypothetical protein
MTSSGWPCGRAWYAYTCMSMWPRTHIHTYIHTYIHTGEVLKAMGEKEVKQLLVNLALEPSPLAGTTSLAGRVYALMNPQVQMSLKVSMRTYVCIHVCMKCMMYDLTCWTCVCPREHPGLDELEGMHACTCVYYMCIYIHIYIYIYACMKAKSMCICMHEAKVHEYMHVWSQSPLLSSLLVMCMRTQGMHARICVYMYV